MVASALTSLFEDEMRARIAQKEKNKREDDLRRSRFQIKKHSMAESSSSKFKMPLQYPRYTKKDYEDMPEWKLDHLLADYGLPTRGTLADKRQSAMSAFLWDPEANTDGCRFQMPLHYPVYTKKDYEAMEEWKLDHLLAAYGLTDYKHCDLAYKREFAATTFLWSQSDSTH